MFFRLFKIFITFSLIFVLANAGNLVPKQYELYTQNLPGTGDQTSDSTTLNSGPIAFSEAFHFERNIDAEEKDSPSSLNSVNLIIHMIYKVTNKTIK
ncbi:MAG TPA: hypothetical protein VI583_14970 [Cyclobacteriaceae bacterium]|nr:hypothetical protein [Cyclobacteriaceae bacterium]